MYITTVTNVEERTDMEPTKTPHRLESYMCILWAFWQELFLWQGSCIQYSMTTANAEIWSSTVNSSIWNYKYDAPYPVLSKQAIDKIHQDMEYLLCVFRLQI